ncbi:MAG TPA: NAD/NADP octopine/nopaline dehydrogenase family protein, partial [Rectinema sp.]|nr:NAD/NADP octopine/nopaline dehydrogenase family protein [Rectinema sp.]
KAPRSIDHRYIWEDVPMSLVPMASMAAMYSIETPAINLIIDLANLMLGQDYKANGRTVHSLGIEGMSVEELHRLVTEG